MSLGSHQRSIGASQIHITPKWIIDAVGPFAVDPCAADPRPWNCADLNYTKADDGLSKPWYGLVWLNPPFHRHEVGKWIAKMAEHGRGIALLHARTETAWFREAWRGASAMLFMTQRVIFHKPDGSLCTTKSGQVANSGAPPVLVAFGNACAERLVNSRIPGALVYGWHLQNQPPRLISR